MNTLTHAYFSPLYNLLVEFFFFFPCPLLPDEVAWARELGAVAGAPKPNPPVAAEAAGWPNPPAAAGAPKLEAPNELVGAAGAAAPNPVAGAAPKPPKPEVAGVAGAPKPPERKEKWVMMKGREKC